MPPLQPQTSADASRITKGPHIYDKENREYVPVTYVHQEFPKMLYHPDFGKIKMPDAAEFVVLPNMNNLQQQAVLKAYNKALADWRRKNRTKLARNVQEEKYFLNKGWLPKPPEVPVAAGEQDSDEI